MADVYILYSRSIDSFYIGSCKNLVVRLDEHFTKKHQSSFTAKADDWSLYFKISNLGYAQSRNIEAHIKRMKSRTYNENLVKYPEIVEKLKQRYSK
ncbi:MAG: GIY-YIG nuclease family protein [Bacteroidales bacterium]|nr:GIY-YIG nuclease family protein [Bacteroidales bacterium]